MAEKVYLALYNSCIYESSATTLSVHLTYEGADRAITKHKYNRLDEWNELPHNHNRKITDYEWWGIQEMELMT